MSTRVLEPEAFLASMPGAYATVFDAEAVKQHAAIVARRDSAALHIEAWRTFPELVVLCVVAKDAPGLLSQVAAALAAEGLSIEAAQVYTRRSESGESEAVDFFWVRHLAGGQLEEATVKSLELALQSRFGN